MKKVIIVLSLLLNVAVYSQGSQTNKDSVTVAISDMDKASEKMIEGKACKEENKALTGALEACDENKAELKTSISILKDGNSTLRSVNENLRANVIDLKKIVKNEKARKLRTGFFGFVAGAATTAIIILLR